MFRLKPPEPDANAFRLIQEQQASGQQLEERKFFKESTGSKRRKLVTFLSGLFKSAFPRETEESVPILKPGSHHWSLSSFWSKAFEA